MNSSFFSLFFAKNGFFKMAALAKGNEAKKAHFKTRNLSFFVCFCHKNG